MKKRPKRYFIAIALSFLVFLVACTMPASGPESPEVPTVTLTPSPTIAPLEVTATATFEPAFEVAIGENLAMDFVASACDAVWSNNAYYLPCPGHLDEIGQGYVEYTDHTVAEGMLSVEAPMLITLPGQGNGNGVGLFGRYPTMVIQAGDTFRATIGCQGDSLCDTEFALEYFDASGKYYDTDWSWYHKAGDGLEEIAVDLSPLVGQMVSLALVARDQNGTSGNWLLWIQPRVVRVSGASPASGPTSTPVILPTPTKEAAAPSQAVIGGSVDSSSAPPYLNDPVLGPSPSIVVVAFNIETGEYWHAPVSPTAHLYFQIDLPAGKYQVVAYAQGVGDVPYVAGGYTGEVPSCGQELKIVEALPGTMPAEEIVVADWNWTCGGTAYRPEKPADVPIP